MSADSGFLTDKDGNPTLSTWDLFVLRHNKRLNLQIHFIAFLMFYGGPIVALVTWNPWWMVAYVLSGPLGAFAHYVSGDGGVNLREATSSPLVVFYVTIMFFKIARRTYAADVEAAKSRYAQLMAMHTSAAS